MFFVTDCKWTTHVCLSFPLQTCGLVSNPVQIQKVLTQFWGDIGKRALNSWTGHVETRMWRKKLFQSLHFTTGFESHAFVGSLKHCKKKPWTRLFWLAIFPPVFSTSTLVTCHRNIAVLALSGNRLSCLWILVFTTYRKSKNNWDQIEICLS